MRNNPKSARVNLLGGFEALGVPPARDYRKREKVLQGLVVPSRRQTREVSESGEVEQGR